MKEIKNHLDQRDFCESHLHMSQMPNVQCPNLTGTMFKAQFKKKKQNNNKPINEQAQKLSIFNLYDYNNCHCLTDWLCA